MTYTTAQIGQALRAARERKGLSQRQLGENAGTPQGRISKIETGAVDLRLSGLIELARALDLELMLVPRKSVPAVKSIIRTTEFPPGPEGETQEPIRPAYSLDEDDHG